MLRLIWTADDGERLRTMPYANFLQTHYWKVIRRYILHTQHGCAVCARQNIPIHVHHKTYMHHGEEHIYPEDLVALCATCHAKFHDKFPRYEMTTDQNS